MHFTAYFDHPAETSIFKSPTTDDNREFTLTRMIRIAHCPDGEHKEVGVIQLKITGDSDGKRLTRTLILEKFPTNEEIFAMRQFFDIHSNRGWDQTFTYNFSFGNEVSFTIEVSDYFDCLAASVRVITRDGGEIYTPLDIFEYHEIFKRLDRLSRA